jgi:epoxyqueuosine reductase
MSPGRSVLALAREAGFHRAGFVDPQLVTPLAARARALRRGGFLDQEAFDGLEWDWLFESAPNPPGSVAPNPRSTGIPVRGIPRTVARWSRTSSILVCCLSCARSEPDDLSSPGDPHALIAPFARANYYRTAMGMLRTLARRLEEHCGIPGSSLRLFSNSRIPEKPLLVASGLAAYGRNGLALVPGLGSLFVIAGAVIPVPLAELQRAPASRHPADSEQPVADLCGSCTRCMSACPVGAIEEPGIVNPALCLQGSAASAVLLESRVMESWGTRLYGCQACQAVCPHNRGLTEEGPAAAGELGPSISIRKILSMDPAALKEWFRGTAMGMSWVSGNALLRNALIAAGNRRDPCLREDVHRFTESGEPMLRRTALWALERMSGCRSGAKATENRTGDRACHGAESALR